ncbi:Metallo-dependent phosphatase-like protein [Aspergillus pseudoustus]|uniref:Metallo-dependent phosphatase-like protein n=1 Tax=Aspergillus pseudoustus TaxID=1810923 RepID=A0ABR4L1W3_9EURO
MQAWTGGVLDRSFASGTRHALLNRPEQESFCTRLVNSPSQTLARSIYALRAPTNPSPSPSSSSSSSSSSSPQIQNPLHIVCISDTHNATPPLPDGDLLIHAGDLTQSGSRRELDAQIAWLDAQPHRFKVVIAGNHEICLDAAFGRRGEGAQRGGGSLKQRDEEAEAEPIDWKSLIYLQNSATTLAFESSGGDASTSADLPSPSRREIKIFGSPYTPQHGNWAFQYARADGARMWEEEICIPSDTDILITHGPPRGHLDLGFMGCMGLRRVLWGMKMKGEQRPPLVHVFGHVHGGYGREVAFWDGFQQAYEGALERRTILLRWVCLTMLVWYGILGVLTGWYGSGGAETVMVNAAAVGGVHDEKRREAICVDI